MNAGIFLIQDNDELVEMNEQAYDSESLLQMLLVKYPSLLAGNQIDPSMPRRWLLIERECGVPSEEGRGARFAIDHLFLDQKAIPTIVEVKRSTNTEIRRKIVGQMLDYAANAVVYWPVEYMRERFAKTNGPRANEKLNQFLDDEMEPEEFWQLANKNLHERNIRLLFVADEIPTELQRVVEFLNEQMDRTEVLAIEIKQFMSEVQGQRALRPRVIGQTVRGETVKSPSTVPKMNEETFFARLAENCSPEEIETARRILKWSQENSSHVRWRTKSLAPIFESDSNYPHIPTSVSIDGRVGFNFLRMKNSGGLPDEKRMEILQRLNSIPGINLTEDSIDRKPSFSLSTLTNDGALEQFLNLVAWTVEQVRTRGPEQPRSHSFTITTS